MDIDEKIKEAEKLLNEGNSGKFEELLSELFFEELNGKLTKKQEDKLNGIFARSRGV